MKQYLEILERILNDGVLVDNRTGIKTKMVTGVFFEHNMSDGFPLLTTKEVNWKSAFAEMLGFIRGFDNAQQFRDFGTNVWNANANETTSWLNSPHRKGTDDLGRIYGPQMRDTRIHDIKFIGDALISNKYQFDQLQYIVDQLLERNDNRRLICNYWNVSDVQSSRMALPPCHYSWQVGINNDQLDMIVNFRSHDVFLGYPFNLAGYGLLLEVLAKITKLKPGKLMFMSFNAHLYENHLEQAKLQLTREPKKLPKLVFKDMDFDYLVNKAIVDDFQIVGYDCHPPIKAKMAS